MMNLNSAPRFNDAIRFYFCRFLTIIKESQIFDGDQKGIKIWIFRVLPFLQVILLGI